MGIKCPNCGGRMVFDVPRQMLRCLYCEQMISVPEYEGSNQADYTNDTYVANLFTCRNCGAELVAPEEQTVAYCSYCGGEAVLRQKDTEMTRPKRIIPFTRSAADAAQAYSSALKSKLYVPKDFKRQEFLNGFRGIYLPYWSFQAQIPNRMLKLTGSANYTKGGYDYSEKYDISAEVGGEISGFTYDASEAFDDTIAGEIAPYSRGGEREFSEGYLAGFYADKATAAIGVYQAEAEKEAVESVFDEIEKRHGRVKVDRPAKDRLNEMVNVERMTHSVSLLPVWFLTWRKDDRVAYSVMNGQTGKITMDIPVDRKKFFLMTAIFSVVVFVLLTLISGFILPKTVAWISAAFLVISTITLQKELYKIYVKENHLYDYGDRSGTLKKKERKRAAQKEPEKEKKKGSSIVVIAAVVALAIVMVPSLVGSVLDIFTSGNTSLISIIIPAAMIVQFIFMVKILKYVPHLERKTACIPAVLGFAVLLAGSIIVLTNPAADYWYYGTAIAELLIMAGNGLSGMNYMNYLTTRPAPNFFTREGANYNA